MPLLVQIGIEACENKEINYRSAYSSKTDPNVAAYFMSDQKIPDKQSEKVIVWRGLFRRFWGYCSNLAFPVYDNYFFTQLMRCFRDEDGKYDLINVFKGLEDYINDNELFDKLLNLGHVREAFDELRKNNKQIFDPYLVYPDFNDIGELNKEDAELFLHCMKVLNTSETNIKDYKL